MEEEERENWDKSTRREDHSSILLDNKQKFKKVSSRIDRIVEIEGRMRMNKIKTKVVVVSKIGEISIQYKNREWKNSKCKRI